MAKKIFPTTKSLEPLVKVVIDTQAALNDPERTLKDVDDKALYGALDAVFGTVGLAGGGLASFGILYAAGTVGLSAVGLSTGLAAAGAIVGGGMAAGVFVLAAPIVGLGAGGVGIAKLIKNKKLKDAKWHLLLEAKDTYRALEKLRADELNFSEERKSYLHQLDILLSRGITDLQSDV